VKLNTGSALVLMDIAGYYIDGAGSVFNPRSTTRIFDQTVGTSAATVPMPTSGPAARPAGATAAVLNVEVFNPSAAGYVRVTPFGQNASVATQEFLGGQSISNLVTVKLVGGAAQVILSAGSGRVLIDIAGYYTSDPGSVFQPITTTRIFDQQVGTQAVDVPVGTGTPVPEWATAVVVNIEVFNPSAAGYLRVTPYLNDASVATQQFVRGQTISNLVVVRLTSGHAQVKLSAGNARVLMDVAGYFS
jgi:hypothetical protein